MNNNTINQKYFSFCGQFIAPSKKISSFLEGKFPEKTQEVFQGINSHEDEVYTLEFMGFREGLQYKFLPTDGPTVHLAVIRPNLGHLVVSCREAGWVENGFITLDNGWPVKYGSCYNSINDSL